MKHSFYLKLIKDYRTYIFLVMIVIIYCLSGNFLHPEIPQHYVNTNLSISPSFWTSSNTLWMAFGLLGFVALYWAYDAFKEYLMKPDKSYNSILNVEQKLN